MKQPDLGTTILVSAVVALLNVVVGTLIAWVLVRDEFPGKRFVDALIDLRGFGGTLAYQFLWDFQGLCNFIPGEKSIWKE